MDDNDSPPEIRLTNEEAVNVCRLEQKEKCCAFLTFDVAGFACIKNTNLCDVILERIKNGKMYPKGEGGWEGCLWKKQCDDMVSSETNPDISDATKE